MGHGGGFLFGSIFDDVFEGPRLFRDKEVLRHSYTPDELPHRTKEVQALASNLRDALEGQTPSNMILYGHTGAGKTAVTRVVCQQLELRGEDLRRPVTTTLVNCRQIDTQYRVLTRMVSSLGEPGTSDVPFTGWPTDRVLSRLRRRMDERGGVHVVVLDEIDHLVKKSGNDLLYNLTQLNVELQHSRVCIIGISNDLRFLEALDPRVRSRLGQHDVMFSPYNAGQLRDILAARAAHGLHEGAAPEEVVLLCSALAAQEHGDARRALDLLRVSTEIAEAGHEAFVDVAHVRQAQNRIETDQMVPAIQELPLQQKLILFAVLINERNGLRRIWTGEVYAIYKQVCRRVGVRAVTQRRVTDLISELDMLGLITAQIVSRGRGGRSKEISSSIPAAIDAVTLMAEAEPVLRDVMNHAYRIQVRL